MNSGRDREHPIELDDGGSDSDISIQVHAPRHHRRHAKDSLPKRASTTRDGFLKEPQPTLRAISPPLTREPHLLDENTPRSKHGKKHRERRTSHERRRSKHHNPKPEPHETMNAHVPAVEQGPFLPLNPQPQLPLNFEEDPDAVEDAPYPHPGYHLPDLGLGDPDLDERFWGNYLANEDQFPEEGVLEQEALEQEQWNEFFVPEDENFNGHFPHEHLPAFGQAPVIMNEVTNQRVPLDPTPPTDDDVQYVREVAVTIDDQLQEDSCLAKILEVLPDISQDHVRTLYQERRTQDFQYSAIRDDRARYDPSEHLIQQIMEQPSYPKQRDTKRKRPLSSDASQGDDDKWGAGDGPRDKEYLDAAYVHLTLHSASHMSDIHFLHYLH